MDWSSAILNIISFKMEKNSQSEQDPFNKEEFLVEMNN